MQILVSKPTVDTLCLRIASKPPWSRIFFHFKLTLTRVLFLLMYIINMLKYVINVQLFFYHVALNLVRMLNFMKINEINQCCF